MFNLPPLLAHIAEIITLLLITFAVTGAGLRILALTLPPPFRGRAGERVSIGERLIFAVALGYGLLAYLTFALGLLGLLYWQLVLGLIIVLAAIGLSPLQAALHEAWPPLRAGLASLRYPPNFFLAVIVTLAAVATLIKALVPPATQDDLMYHLALPARYVAQHSVGFQPDSSYSLFPQTMEMLYTVGLLFGSDRLAMLFAYAIALLGPLAAALFAKRYLAPNADGLWRSLPLLTAALFLSTPLILFILRAANTDPAQATFDVLTAYAVYLALYNKPQSAICNLQFAILAGIFAGLSLGVKYNGFAIALTAGLGLLAMLLHRRARLGMTLRALLAYGLPALLIGGVWLLRNFVAAGNPLWPLATNLLGGAYSSLDYPPAYLLGSTPPLSLDSLCTAFSFMWTAMTRAPIGIDNQQQVVSLGPLLLPLLLLLPLAKWKPALAWLAYLAAAYWLLWAALFSRTSARYLTSFFLLAALLGAYALVSLITRLRLLGWLGGGLVALLLAYLVSDATSRLNAYLPVTFALDRATETQYLANYMEDYRLIQQIAALPVTATIYVWDSQPRGYYLPRPYIYARLVPLYSDFGSLDLASWRSRLRDLGITHVLYHPRNPLAPGLARNYDPYAAAAQQFITRYFGPPIAQVGEYTLYPLH